MSTVYANKHNEWLLVEGEELELARRLEAEAHEITFTSHAARKDLVWSCSLCVEVDEVWPLMQEHFKAKYVQNCPAHHAYTDAHSCLRTGIRTKMRRAA